MTRLVPAVLAALGALAVAFVATVDVWRAPTIALLGDWTHPDMLSNHWVYTWVAEQVRSGGSLLHNDRYYVPEGDAPFLAGNASGALLASPFLLVLGWPLGLNVYLGLVLALNTLGGWALARVVDADRVAAGLAGVAFGVSGYVLNELGAARFAQVPVWEMAFGMAAWIGAIERRSWGRAAVAGLLFGLAGVEYFYHGLFAVLAAAVVGVTALLRLGPGRIPTMLVGACATLVVVGPLLYVFLTGWSAVVGTAESDVFPHPFMLQASLPWSWPLWSDVATMVPQFVDWLVLGFAAAAAWRGRQDWRVRALAAVAGLGWVLSLGPQLLTPIGPAPDSHLPFWWLYSLHPALSRFWWPYRHAVLVFLGLAPLAARTLSAVRRALPPRLGLLVCLVCIVELPAELSARGAYTRAVTSQLTRPPDWVAELRALGEGVRLDLPMAPELWVGQQHLLLQFLTGHRLLEGHAMWVDRVRPDAWDEAVAANTFLAELQRFERGLPDADDPARVDHFRYDPADVAALGKLGVRWVTVWTELYPLPIEALARREAELLDAVFGTPVVTADGMTVWALASFRGHGDEPAPAWQWPDGVRTGDGSNRMTDALPTSHLVEQP